MFGYEKDNGDVIITDIILNFEEYYTAINEGRKVSCAFEEQSSHMKSFKLIEESIDYFAKYSKYKRPVILSGHTHPDLSPVYGPNSRFSSGTNFSWCDVRGLIETEKIIADKGTEFGKDVQYGHILINGILDFDVISYQNFGDGYKLYKHPEIYFGDDRLRSFTKNKYLIKDDVEKTF